MATSPGIHVDFNWSNYPITVKNAITSLSKDFYITRALSAHAVGNSVYYATLARPTDRFSVYVNADREVLILFADYDAFEIRTLEAYDHFYGLLDQSRVDKSIRFLVSSDPQIENRIRSFLAQKPEYPIIVPITFESLMAGGRDTLVDATRRNYLLRDLFGHQSPLREETFFFGRQEVVKGVLDNSKLGQSSSIFGLRKSGKTSTIFAIARKAKGFDCIPLIIDCQNPSIHGRSYSELLTYILTELRRAVGVSKPMADLQGEVHIISDAFAEQMRRILGTIKSKVLLIFDEIENISPITASSKHWRQGEDTIYFWQIIRAFAQGDKDSRLAVCLVGTNPSLLESPKIGDVANPMYLFAQKKYLPSLTFDETRQMVERLGHFMGMEFDPSITGRLHADYGGHPFFIRQVCSRIHQNLTSSRPIQISLKDLERSGADFATQLDGYMSEIVSTLREFYPAEVELLIQYSAGNDQLLEEYATDAPDLIDHLLGYGLVERRGASVEIKLEVVKKALSRVLVDKSLEFRWAEISKRRNSLERSIRRALFYVTKPIDAESWRLILSSQLTESSFGRLTTYEPSVLFSDSSTLYFMDLLCILKSEAIFSHWGDRRKDFISALNTINRFRKDAHAGGIGDADFELVLEAFGLLELEFSI